MTDYGDTLKAKRNRLDKAEKIADFMVETRILHAPDEAGRRAIERAAGVRRSSFATWQLALEIWQERRNV